ncbi:hydrophobin family protein [Aspergillus glaucus CBS 516.65]|uniref:Hydrophobin n=1 Tax=Aspergillus glaucus CBS 516.65 TaxID=1160497 RepID=A0A1L9VVK2_ASPGL|nr:hypothetical protein ASPGLDRAFT_43017 [Aspergillus glaucus CBS 516.65]OJJ87942.1 hypothetical protein ASPGLDRAFT_43017 [Aspergillus glaucus CBS 516.65]
MKFFAIAATFAATAMALPSANGAHKDPKQLSLEQAQNTCGKAQVSCCNKQISSGDSFEKNEGILNGVLSGLLGDKGSQGLGLFDQCSKLDVSVLIGLSDLLGNSDCNQNIACCDATNAEAEGGLVNVALPCVQLQDLI